MKYRSTCLMALLAMPVLVFAQLTLESVNGNRTKTIDFGEKIELVMPTFTTNDDCNCCFESHIGKLSIMDTDKAGIQIMESRRTFTDTDGIFKRQTTDFQWKNSPPTLLPTTNLLSVKHYPKSRNVLDKVGATLMLCAGLHALILSPSFDYKSRKTVDRIVLGSFALGFAFAIVPNAKTYYIKQPTGSSKPLWKVKEWNKLTSR